MKKTVKDNLNNHLESFELSSDQLNVFDEIEKKILQPTASNSNRKTVWALVASIVMVGVLMANLMPMSIIDSGAKKSQQALVYAIAQEVSYNHLKLKPLEVANNQLNQVTQYFKKLDFNPLASSQVSALSNRLIGGRYCSIQGNIAAQLRMEDEKGVISTLFESRYNVDDFGFLPKLENKEAPVSVHVDGQHVKIWIEKGLVMALVTPISS